MKNNWFYISLIFGLCLVALYFWESPSEMLRSGKLASGDDQRTPYAIIENAQTQHFDENGKLSYQFFTKTLRHFRIDLDTISLGDYTSLESPKLTLYTNDGPWFVTAEHGKATENGEVLTLWNNVKIWQDNENKEQAIELTTDKLIIDPLNKTVNTVSKVTITSAQGHIEALGMSVNLINKQIKLLNQVRGYHEPI